MLVSVVITAYNFASLVAETIESALAQTHRDMQIIVVDDASTDATPAVLAGFGSRIEVVRHEKNQGVLRATLTGIRHARSDVVAFLDGDDLWERDKLAHVMRVMRSRPNVVLCSHDYRLVDERGAVIREDDGTQAVLRRLTRAGDLERVDRVMRRGIVEYRGHVWLGSAFVIRKSGFDLERFERFVGGLAHPELVYQDHPLATFIALTSRSRCAYVDKKLFQYRIHSANYSGAASDISRAQRIIAKGRATAEATRALVLEYAPDDAAAMRIQDARLREYDFLRDTYEGHRASAFGHFAHCAKNLWPLRLTFKEAARFGFVSTFGAGSFFAMRDHVSRAQRRVWRAW